MTEWKEYKVGEVADVQTGPFGSQLHMHDYVVEGTPIITVEHFGENKILHKNLPLVSDADKTRLIKYTLKEGDVVFSRVGSVDRRVYVRKHEDGWMFSGRCLRVRCNPILVNGKFLSYYFGQESFKEYIRMVAVGATMPSINTQILSEAPIEVPPLPEQERIAEVLSSLDDKIDLFHRNNKTLEQLAETLFRQWFVEEAEESWEEAKFSDLVNVKYGKDHKRLEDGIYPVYGSGGLMRNVNNFIYDKESVLIPRKGTLSNIIYCNSPFWTVDTMFYTEMKRKNIAKFIFHFIINQDLASMNVGSAVPSMTTEILNNLPIWLPPDEKLLKFDQVTSDLYKKKEKNDDQIKKLENLRDAILPKLMNGSMQVEIKV